MISLWWILDGAMGLGCNWRAVGARVVVVVVAVARVRFWVVLVKRQLLSKGSLQ